MSRLAPTLALMLVVPWLAACGRDEASPDPESAAPAEEAVEPSGPVPADRFTTELPAPEAPAGSEGPVGAAPARVVAPNVPNHEDRRIRMAIEELPPAETGGPVNIADEAVSADRAFEVLYRYLGRKGLATESFYMKYSDEVGGYRYYMFFGVPVEGEGMYVHMRLFPDGRVEIID